MDSSRKVKIVTSPFLFLLEYFFKISAGIASLITLAAPGPFIEKIGTGFGSLFNIYNRLLEWPEKLAYLGNVIHDYNNLTASAFNQRYGGQAMNRTMESLNEAVLYVQSAYTNLAEDPFTTAIAVLLTFILLYLIGRTCRFVRQRGEGSYLVRKERELGKRLFHKSDNHHLNSSK